MEGQNITSITKLLKWLWRIDWEMIELEQGPWLSGETVTLMNPYFIETWRNKSTGEIKIYNCI